MSTCGAEFLGIRGDAPCHQSLCLIIPVKWGIRPVTRRDSGYTSSDLRNRSDTDPPEEVLGRPNLLSALLQDGKKNPQRFSEREEASASQALCVFFRSMQLSSPGTLETSHEPPAWQPVDGTRRIAQFARGYYLHTRQCLSQHKRLD